MADRTVSRDASQQSAPSAKKVTTGSGYSANWVNRWESDTDTADSELPNSMPAIGMTYCASMPVRRMMPRPKALIAAAATAMEPSTRPNRLGVVYLVRRVASADATTTIRAR